MPPSSRRLGDTDAVQNDVAVRHRHETGKRFGQRKLAVAGHAGDAEDFAGRQFEGNIADGAALDLGGNVAHLKHRHMVAMAVSAVRSDPIEPRPTIASTSAAGERSAAAARSTTLPPRITTMRSAQAAISASLWVISTTALPSAASDLMKPYRRSVSAGVEHRGRLVENDHAGIEIENLGEFDQLAFADAEVAHRPVRIEVGRQLLEPAQRRASRAGCRAIAAMAHRASAASRFSSTDSAGISENCWNTMPMPCAIASRGDVKRDLRSVDVNGAAIRLVEPVEDLHQRALAGAVLAEQGQHFAGCDLEADIVIGDDGAEFLPDRRQR